VIDSVAVRIVFGVLTGWLDHPEREAISDLIERR